jgi:hypothetical protein
VTPLENRFKDALNDIKAEEQLKSSTMAFLRKKVYQKKQVSFRRFAGAFASLAIVLFAGLFSHNLYFTESAYIDIDVNPSIELTLNRFDRVIGVYAYNEDGQRVLDTVNIRNKSYQDALSALVDKMVELGYIKDSGLFTATLQTKNGEASKEKLDALISYLDSVLQSDGRTVEENIFVVNSETKTHAHDQNLTPAKYLAILELQSFDPTATFDSCRDHSISEINQQIHDHENDGEHESGSDDEHSGGNDGNTGGNEETGHHNEPAVTNQPSNPPAQNQSGEHDDEENEHGHD